ncbi:NADH dehydrogenase [ubiquinone] flavoprotein 3, mitochondrial isoform X2 [Dendropsophus ebraccatus]|uniref:NADH dehydrogenase [ubiquinone] flavoprotein 3, mitochondrial isoform X2 n=1 Tax=Dendropsophus ebraccatus TaxID=150705 RepID=UPI0038316B5B
MATALRSVRRLQVMLLRGISVTSVRAETGGKGSPHTEYSKTLVSFAVKVSHFQQPATGETRNEHPGSVMAPLLNVGGLGGESYRETQLEQSMADSSARSIGGTQRDDSSSSSDSSSDSEGEENIGPDTGLQADKGESGARLQGLPSAGQKSSVRSVQLSVKEESPVAPEQSDKMEMRGGNAEDLQDAAPVITTEKPTNMTPPRVAKKSPDRTDFCNEASSTAATSSKFEIPSPSQELSAGGVQEKSTKTQNLSSPSKELPGEEVDISAPESRETHILSSTTSEELLGEEVDTSAPESRETHILSSTTSEELLGGDVETSAPESRETHILSSTTSEELLGGEVDTSAPESRETHILSSTTSEELLGGDVETSAPESRETHILSSTTSEELLGEEVDTSAPESRETHILSSTTSEELLGGEEAVELHESNSPMEPRPAPQEPFDNTKYQNLEHFTYTPFTFVDMDVELAKYRLPQPTSGRPSPRH